jgi:hypothetical protein
MKVTVQVIMTSDSGATEVVHDVAHGERDTLQPETLGLTLAEAKTLLEGVQQAIVSQQTEEFIAQQMSCPSCGRGRLRKGDLALMIRTLFGKLRLRSPRLYHCGCQTHPTRTFSPLAALLPEHTAPELLYLEAKFVSLMSYGLTMKLLAEVLPMGREVNATTIRNHLQEVAQRCEDELGDEQAMFIEGCERDWEELPRPALPLTVGIDGGYVHSCEQTTRHEGWFEVIVGKSVPAEGAAKCFGFVQSYDAKPKRRLFELLQS